MLDKFPLVIDTFKGVKVSDQDYYGAFENDYQEDIVKIDEAFIAKNVEFLKTGGFKTRTGLSAGTAFNLSPTGEITGFWQIKSLLGVNQTNRWLILTWDGTTGRMYDTGVTGPATNPVYTVTGMKFAFVINAFEKMWISPWSDWGVPCAFSYANKKLVYIYTGAYNAREAKGQPPSDTIVLANSATPGSVTAGYHYFATLFEYDSGYITRMDPAVTGGSKVLNATGFQISATVIPTGGTGVVARHIVMTKIITPYPNPIGTGFQNNEPFFVARIGDNTTTTLTINMPDSGLVDSAAAYILKSDFITPCVSMAVYRNRMVYIGFLDSTRPISEDSVFVSPVGEPEEVDIDNGDGSLIILGKDYQGRPNCGAELRGTFYVFKQNSTFAFTENADLEPQEWSPILIDSGIGASPIGVANTGNNPGSLVLDNLLVANPAGLFAFSGTFVPVPLSKGIWDPVTVFESQYSRIYVDPVRKRIYLLTGPIITATGTIPNTDKSYVSPISKIYMGDYNLGYDSESIKWSTIEITPVAGVLDGFRWIVLQDLPDYAPYPLLTSMYLEGTNFKLAIQKPNNTTDLGTPISWNYDTGYTPNDKGDLYNFTHIRARMLGIDAQNIGLYHCPMDSNTFAPIVVNPTAIAPKKFYTFPLSVIGEKMRFRFSGTTRAMITKLVIFANEVAKDRAR